MCRETGKFGTLAGATCGKLRLANTSDERGEQQEDQSKHKNLFRGRYYAEHVLMDVTWITIAIFKSGVEMRDQEWWRWFSGARLTPRRLSSFDFQSELEPRRRWRRRS